uniref:Uncharacterized protein n=1 Tax=Lygus hesperus TaxID=30085 RepID=A0A146M986_LYGHE
MCKEIPSPSRTTHSSTRLIFFRPINPRVWCTGSKKPPGVLESRRAVPGMPQKTHHQVCRRMLLCPTVLGTLSWRVCTYRQRRRGQSCGWQRTRKALEKSRKKLKIHPHTDQKPPPTARAAQGVAEALRGGRAQCRRNYSTPAGAVKNMRTMGPPSAIYLKPPSQVSRRSIARSPTWFRKLPQPQLCRPTHTATHPPTFRVRWSSSTNSDTLRSSSQVRFRAPLQNHNQNQQILEKKAKNQQPPKSPPVPERIPLSLSFSSDVQVANAYRGCGADTTVGTYGCTSVHVWRCLRMCGGACAGLWCPYIGGICCCTARRSRTS